MAEILLIEDEASLRESMRISLAREHHQIEPVSRVGDAIATLQRRAFDLVIADLRLPDGDALDILRELALLEQRPASIVITAHGSIDTAVEAMRLGAFDFIPKPFRPERLTTSVTRALEHQRLRAELRRRSAQLGHGIHGTSEAAETIRRLVQQAADARAVLVTGETGTGKDLVARAIHRAANPESPLIVIHCGALPESLIESELFGHVRGAFSGATSARPGLLSEADGGTAFLDEVGEIPLALQTRLLRFLETGEVRAVGSDHPRTSRCQVIAATHRDLAADVQSHRFRQDLLYRLDVFRIPLPPLRDRIEDIPDLAAALLRRITGRLRRPVPTLGADALAVLQSYRWPGNIRELEHTLERALLLGREASLPADLLEACMGEPEIEAAAGDTEQGTEPADASAPTMPLAAVEKQHILLTLERFGGDRSKTARALGIARSTLRRKLIEYSGKAGARNDH